MSLKDKLTKNLFIPNATVFIASFCIMVIELTAGRLIARFLGVSLYTWTSVIGVVLAGIALGNYIGGRLADNFRTYKILSVLFILAAISCFFIPFLNKIIGNWYVFMLLPFPLRTALHVLAAFLIPSLLLGAIAPIVAKFALDKGFPTGRTVGNVYAWGATGSILGVFITGFLLIPNIGTIGIIFSITAVLALLAIFYGRKFWFSYLGVVLLIVLSLVAFSAGGWQHRLAVKLGWQQIEKDNLVYQDESYYSYIRVENLAGSGKVRKLILNQMLHSVVDVDNPTNLEAYYQYPYLRIYASLAKQFHKNKQNLHTLTIGGGGYVFPRYLQKNWPASLNEVVEIDPAVTEAAVKTLGFDKKGKIKVHHLDARNYIDRLLVRKNKDSSFNRFDLIYGDAVSDLSVPYQLTTYEYNEKIKALLVSDGAYIVTVIDSPKSAKFLSALVKTLEKTFPQVGVIRSGKLTEVDSVRNVFVIAAFKQPLDLGNIEIAKDDGVLLTENKLSQIIDQSEDIILTDNYAPLENLLEPVVSGFAQQMAAVKLTTYASKLTEQNKNQKAAKYYKKALQLDSRNADAHNNFGNLLATEGKLQQAKQNFRKAIKASPYFAGAYNNLGTIQMRQGNFSKAADALQRAARINPESADVWYNLGNVYLANNILEKAEKYYKKAIEKNPDFAKAYNSLGTVLFLRSEFNQALKYYKKAIELNDNFAKAHNNIGTIFAKQGKIDQAIFHFRKAVDINPGYENARKNLYLASSEKRGEKVK